MLIDFHFHTAKVRPFPHPTKLFCKFLPAIWRQRRQNATDGLTPSPLVASRYSNCRKKNHEPPKSSRMGFIEHERHERHGHGTRISIFATRSTSGTLPTVYILNAIILSPRNRLSLHPKNHFYIFYKKIWIFIKKILYLNPKSARNALQIAELIE